MAYWIGFILATYSITQFFGGYRYFQSGSELEGYLMNTMWLLMFLASMIFMAYRIYSEERAKDNIRVEFAPFEKFYVMCRPKPGVQPVLSEASGSGSPRFGDEVLTATALPQDDNRRNK
ncbi:MAG: hypothetical protein OXU45_06885 [Candidatus Melainabacteria bacterium]|nr:hypothetical protein [Candidatus Melainabacteria bacterium]